MTNQFHLFGIERSFAGAFIFLGLSVVFCFAADSNSNEESSHRDYDLPAGSRIDPEEILSIRWIIYHGKRLPGKEGVYGSDRDFDQLKNVLQLESIKLGPLSETKGFILTAEGLRNLTQLQRLKRVQFQGMIGSEEKLEVLSLIPNLQELIIQDSDLSNQSAKAISQMKRLRYLDLEGTQVGNSFFKKIAFPDELTHLRLDATNVDAKVIKYLPQTLTHLSLIGAKVDDSIVSEVPKMDRLQVLEITGVSHASLDKIREKLPSLKINPSALESF